MSDLRVSYASFESDDDTFVSQQMQVASVRVQGVDTVEQEVALFEQHKQDITQFFRFCDNQHRLSGRGHSAFVVDRGDVQMRYVNDAGQPLIFVSPAPPPEVPERPEREPPKIPVPRDITPIGYVRVEFLNGTDNTGEVDIFGARSGKTVTLPAVDDATYIIFFSDNPEDDTLTLEAFTERLRLYFRGEFFDEFDAATTLIRFPAVDGPRFSGTATGYLAVDGISATEYVVIGPYEYDVPQPLFSIEVGVAMRLEPDTTVREDTVFPGDPLYEYTRRFTNTNSTIRVSVEAVMYGPYAPDARNGVRFSLYYATVLQERFPVGSETSYQIDNVDTGFEFELVAETYAYSSEQLYDPTMQTPEDWRVRVNDLGPQFIHDGADTDATDIRTIRNFVVNDRQNYNAYMVPGFSRGGAKMQFFNHQRAADEFYTIDAVKVTDIEYS